MVGEFVDYRDILKDELSSRCQKNPRYSLRAFARDVGLSSARISEVLNYKHGLSRKSGTQISKKLGFSNEEAEYFCTLIESSDARSRIVKENASQKIKQINKQKKYNFLQMDMFKIISDWYHFAILELTYLKNFKSTPEWISSKLGITLLEVKEAINRLKKIGMLQEKNNKLFASEDFTASPDGVPSEIIKKSHTQILNKAEKSLYLDHIGVRDFSAITMSFDSSKINEAKKAIKEFRRKFCDDFNKNKSKNRVYCIAIQFFPLDKKEEGTK